MNFDLAAKIVRQPIRQFGVSHTCKATVPVLVFLCLTVQQAKADIWGYVDSERMPHFASSRLDDRYELFLRDSKIVEPFTRAEALATALEDEQKDASADAAKQAMVPASTVRAAAVSPRLLAFFEHSENYKAVSPLLHQAAKIHGIDYSLLKALIVTESGFNPYAVSPKGAVGLMQVIPPTAERYGVAASKNSTVAKKLTDPRINIKTGTRYLADLIKMFPGRLELAVAAYNAGEGAVQRAGNKIPNYPETQNYVKTVMQLYTSLAPPQLSPAAGRLRVEAKGGSTGRSNIPSPVDLMSPRLRADSLPD